MQQRFTMELTKLLGNRSSGAYCSNNAKYNNTHFCRRRTLSDDVALMYFR